MGRAPTHARQVEDGFVGLTTGKALSVLLAVVGLLASGFLFLVVHVWDGISDDIKDLRNTARADLTTLQTANAAQSEAAGEFKAFVQNQLPEITKQIKANSDNASVDETRRQVAALSQTVDRLRDSVLKKTDLILKQKPPPAAIEIGAHPAIHGCFAGLGPCLPFGPSRIP